VVGARIRFTVTSGNGVISGPGVDANGIVLTDDKGVARAAWALRNADPAGNPNTGHRVTAELLDSANTRVHLPVVFHATLNSAAKVAYDPKNCAGMNSAQPPVVTVQDALDHLCARDDDAADCCYSVGEIDGKPGDFPTLKEALAALFDQKTERSAICLSLLPGEHFLSEEIELEPKDAAVLKINGCNHAARLFIEAPLLLRRFEGVVIRDISIAIIGEEARIRFDDCRLVEITHCVIVGRDTGSALLSFSEVGRLVASKNLLRALAKKATDSNDRGPSSFENIAGARTEADTSKYTAALLAKFEGMSAAERAAAVAKLKTEFAHAESKLSPAEAAAYKELLELLGSSSSSDADMLSKKVAAVRKLSARRRAKEFADLTHVSESTTSARVPGTESMVAAPGAPRAPGGVLFEAFSIGVAILFEDAEADVTLDDNYILGEVRHLDDGTEKGPLTEAELKNFGPLFTSGAITLRPASLGFLRVRGNTIMRFASGDALADQIRELIKNKKGELPVWAGAQFTDNRFGGLDNFFVSARLMLTANQFAGGGSGTDVNAQDLALVIAARAAFTGNIARISATSATKPPRQETSGSPSAPRFPEPFPYRLIMPTPTGSTPSSDFTQALDATNAEVMALQPAVLANLALANEVFNTNLQQQMLIAQQQAMNQLILATVGKCVSIISQAETRDIKVVHELLALLKSLQPIPSAVGTVPAPVGPAAA
jgi:hypothetical protein